MNKKNKMKAIVAFAVALAFLVPTSAVFANDEVTLSYYINEDFEGTIPPSGWETFFRSGTGGIDWTTNIDMGLSNLAGGDGNCAGVLLVAGMLPPEAWIMTPIIDLSGATGTQLEFTASYTKSGFGQLNVQIKVDDDPWVTMLSWGESHDPDGPGENVKIDLMPYLISPTNGNVQIRWQLSHDGGRFLIDQVKVEDTTVVSIAPATQTVNKGDAFTFSVYVEPSDTPIMGIGFRTLFFNQTLIYVDSIAKGDIVDPNTWVTFIFGNIDNTIGEIGDTVGAVVPADVITTPGSFLVVTCHALQELGTSDLVLYDVDVSDVDVQPIPTTVNNGDVIVEAIYYTLDITVDPVAGGSVDAVPLPDPDGYVEGTSVVLTAVPTSGGEWSFSEWTGDLTGSVNPETIIMDDDKAVTATFTSFGWESPMSFVGDVSFESDTVVFGENIDAEDGIDTMDQEKPEAPPAPFIYAFLATSLDPPYDILWEEFRFYDADNDLQIFDLFVETDTAGGQEKVLVTITWDNTILATEPQYDHIGLYDVSSGDLLEDMKDVGTYVFTADSGMANHFQIICSDNHVPVANDDDYSTKEAHELNVAIPGVLENDDDEDGDTLTAVFETGVSDGTLTLNADGSFVYMPDVDFVGTDSFTYRADDGELPLSNIATVTIEVLELNHIDLQDGWNLISMPVGEPIDKTDILVRYLEVDYTWAEAITEDIILDPTFGWNSGMYTDETVLVPGDGYWMWSYQDCELLIPSNAIADNHITNLDVEWNLVGIPYGTSLTKTQINIYFNGVFYTWANAVAEYIISDSLFDWDRSDQNYALTDIFVPGFGYWVYAYHGCALKKA